MIEEENILVESKDNSYMFSMNYIEKVLYVSVFSKKGDAYLVEDCEIKEPFYQKQILQQIQKPCGTIFQNNNVKFLIRNHDIIGYKNESGRRITINNLSDDNIYDTRNTSDFPILSQIVAFLKEAWLQI